MSTTAAMSHLVVYDPIAAMKIMTKQQAAMAMEISPRMLQNKIENDELYAEAFWQEGTQWRTCPRNILELYAKLGNRNLMQSKAA